MAREAAGSLLAELDFGNRETAVRINRISNLFGLADMTALAQWPHKPDLIVLPKVESAAEGCLYDELLTNSGVQSRLLILIESSRGLLAAPDIASASPRVAGLTFGIVDLASELGCGLSWEVMAERRSALIVAGGYAGIPVFDAPNIHIKNLEGLKEECGRAKTFGFAGKLCIHPSQLEPVNNAFSPTEKEIARAIKIVAAAEARGSGAIVVD